MLITIASFKGGVGKTTTAIHLAAYLANRKGADKVILADGDLNRSALSWAERGGTQVPFQVCDGDSLIEDYQTLIIDTPARPNDDELISLAESSDLMVIPTSPDPFDLEATVKTLSRIAGLPLDRYAVLLTKCPAKNSKRGTLAKQALLEADIPTFKANIQSRTIYADAALAGLPVYALKGTAAKGAWTDYSNLGKEVIKLIRANGGTV
jgi:chromosome partitioning protein